MAESSLSVSKTELDIFIADFLGYGRTSTSWSTDQQARIDQARDEGLSRFYNARNWNFLSPATTLTLTVGDYTYDLEDDFGSMATNFNYPADESYSPLTQRNSQWIREQIAMSDTNGIPAFFAVEPKTQTGSTGTRWQVLLYPPPQTAWVMPYRYNILRNALTSTYPYPAGGAAMRTAISGSCLAYADAFWNDNVGGWEQRYQAELLPAAIRADGLTHAHSLGGMEENSDGPSEKRTTERYSQYNGVTPS